MRTLKCLYNDLNTLEVQCGREMQKFLGILYMMNDLITNYLKKYDGNCLIKITMAIQSLRVLPLQLKKSASLLLLKLGEETSHTLVVWNEGWFADCYQNLVQNTPKLCYWSLIHEVIKAILYHLLQYSIYSSYLTLGNFKMSSINTSVTYNKLWKYST